MQDRAQLSRGRMDHVWALNARIASGNATSWLIIAVATLLVASALAIGFLLQSFAGYGAALAVPQGTGPHIVLVSLLSAVASVLALSLLLKFALVSAAKFPEGKAKALALVRVQHLLSVLTLCAFAALYCFVFLGQIFLSTEMSWPETQIMFVQRLVDWPLLLIFAPIAEELFFRGWLWRSLSRRISIPYTALVVGLLWLIPHLFVDIRYLWTVPVAAMLSFARFWGRSVYASIMVHMSYNFVVVTFPVYLSIKIHEKPLSELFALLTCRNCT